MNHQAPPLQDGRLSNLFSIPTPTSKSRSKNVTDMSVCTPAVESVRLRTPTFRRWQNLFSLCFEKRIRPKQIGPLVKELLSVAPAPGRRIAQALLKPRNPGSTVTDPLQWSYVDELLALNQIDIVDVLEALLKYSQHHPTHAEIESQETGKPRLRNPLALESIILYRMARCITSAERPNRASEVRGVIEMAAQWMISLCRSDDILQAAMGETYQVQQQALMIREELGMLVEALLNNTFVCQTIVDSLPSDRRRKFAKALDTFIPFLAQSSSHVATRLQMNTTRHILVDPATDGVLVGGDETMPHEASVVDLPFMHSRAGLYIYINALGDSQSLLIDLIVTSFDALSNAIYRSDPAQVIFSLRSFVVNKIPTLISHWRPSLYPPLTTEYCIEQALTRLDVHTSQSLVSIFGTTDSNSKMVAGVRQDFIVACTLHGLVSKQSIGRLLGQTSPKSISFGNRSNEDFLVTQCSTNPQRVEELINAIEAMDGNVGAVVGAVTRSLDVILQYTKSSNLLQPLCQLLDDWRYDEDQGEHQPAYEEFAAVLLLVLAFVHRYNLTILDIGISSPSSFVAKVLEQGSTSQPNSTLSKEQSRCLNGWVLGLFETDETGETKGISDDTMSLCSPQEFYLLVPTLFDQTVNACMVRVLDVDTMKEGLEFLLEPFLLPSLIGALTWLTRHSWEDHGNANIVMQVIDKLVRPTSISGDAQAMHGTILSIVGNRLEQSLRTLQAAQPSRQDIEPVLSALQPYLNNQRTTNCHITEVQSWMQNGGLQACIRNTMQSLVLWSSTADISMMPPSYTHRQILLAVRTLGPDTVLRAILEEVRNQTDNGNGAMALDVGTALICAPTAEVPQSSSTLDLVTSTIQAPPAQRLSLREHLRLRISDKAKVQAMDVADAEALVRLSRRVEAQMAGPQIQMSGLDVSAPDMMQTMQGLDMTGTVADTAALDAAINQPLDLSGAAGAEMMDQALGLAGAGGALDGIDLGMGAAGAHGGGDLSMADIDAGDVNMDGLGSAGADDDWGLDLDFM
ncbi:hypothetical protein LTR04_002562 [Oleoguttula sp. CCFEE 6159]|nr:hypothetical protein LTR04_002562 [Oleoguttula sp. CCFEE 6159]